MILNSIQKYEIIQGYTYLGIAIKIFSLNTLLIFHYTFIMNEFQKLLFLILQGNSDANISFPKICYLLKHLGFKERIKGSHHIYTMQKVEEIINLQPDGNRAKPYQVKQVRNLIVKYKLGEFQDG